MAHSIYLTSGNANKDHLLPLEDFIPKWREEDEEVGEETKEEQLRTKAMAMIEAYGGRR